MNSGFRKWLYRTLLVFLTLVVLLVAVGWYKLYRVEPQQLANDSPEELFKYGSIGAEEREGLPYYVWAALPRIFPEYLPKDSDGKTREGGYLAFGVAWEPGRELPVGFSKRTIGFPRVAINCALCHSASWRDDANDASHVVPMGPSTAFDSQAYLKFLAQCAADPRFNPENIMHHIQYNVNVKMSWFDRVLYKYIIIPRTKQALLAQSERYAWTYLHQRPPWGPGRIDPFNPVKFQQLAMEDDRTIGNSDNMPIWNLGQRPPRGSQQRPYFHWDGLNRDLTEVTLSSALGDGATRKSLPLKQLARIQEYIATGKSPPNPRLDQIDSAARGRGEQVFSENCAKCHAPGGEYVGSVMDVETDPHRIRMWTQESADRYNAYGNGYHWDFQSFEDNQGYLATALDGLWLRGPYLHNGSVPTVRDLLKPASERPQTFYRGCDILDHVNLGYLSSGEEARRRGRLFDTTLPGNSNAGHEHGVDLSDDAKNDLIAYLQSL